MFEMESLIKVLFFNFLYSETLPCSLNFKSENTCILKILVYEVLFLYHLFLQNVIEGKNETNAYIQCQP